MTQSTVEERWEDRLNNSTITGHISGRHLIKIHSREDFNDENEYEYLDEWIKRIIKSELQLAEQKAREDEREKIFKALGIDKDSQWRLLVNTYSDELWEEKTKEFFSNK